MHHGVPCVRGEGVDVQAGAGAWGPEHKPLVRWPAPLARVLEEVLSPQLWHTIVLHA